MSDHPLPDKIEAVTRAYVKGLHQILGSRLYGIYQHGASVFPEAKPVHDIDCHVVLKRALSKQERQDILAFQETLKQDFPDLGEMFDIYFILRKEARGTSDPQHQLRPEIYDNSWPLHCAHIRAGYYRVLYGPEPHQIFPTPTWKAISSALEKEFVYIRDNLKYPAYCILNLCRILYSYTNRDPAVSKQACGEWACQQFPSWESIIRAALRFYRHQDSPADEILMQDQVKSFLTFSKEQLEIIRGHHPD